MFTFFVGIILLIYIYTVSKRVQSLEERMNRGVQLASQKPVGSAQVPTQPATHFQPVSSAPQTVPSAFDQNIKNISASQWFAGIGIIALLFGLGFFLRYAIDQGWVSESMRVVIGLLVGGLLVALGELWHSKYQKYSRILSGGGLAVLYFSIYAAYQYYSLLDEPIAALVLIVITALGILLSYRYQSKGLMVWALVGGYISPLLLHSAVDRHVALFVYLTILNAGVLAIMVRRFWTELLLVSLIGTACVFALWAEAFFGTANTLNAMIFIIFNFVLTSVISAMLFRKAHERQSLVAGADGQFAAFEVGAGLLYFVAASVLLAHNFDDYIAPVMLVGGIITFLGYVILDRLDYARTNYCMSFVGSGLIASAVLWGFSGKVEDIYLLALALLGAGIGLQQSRKELRTWSLVILLIAAIKTMTHTHEGAAQFLLTSKFALELLGVIALLAVSWGFRTKPVADDERMVPGLLKMLAAGIVWFGVSEEIVRYFDQSENVRNLLLSLWWLGYAVVLGLLSSLRHNGLLRKGSIVLFIVTILKVFLYDVQALEISYRIVSFIVLGAILLIVAFIYQKNKAQIQEFWEGEIELPKNS